LEPVTLKQVKDFVDIKLPKARSPSPTPPSSVKMCQLENNLSSTTTTTATAPSDEQVETSYNSTVNYTATSVGSPASVEKPFYDSEDEDALNTY